MGYRSTAVNVNRIIFQSRWEANRMLAYDIITTVFVAILAVMFLWAGWCAPTNKHNKFGCTVIFVVLAMAIMAIWG